MNKTANIIKRKYRCSQDPDMFIHPKDIFLSAKRPDYVVMSLLRNQTLCVFASQGYIFLTKFTALVMEVLLQVQSSRTSGKCLICSQPRVIQSPLSLPLSSSLSSGYFPLTANVKFPSQFVTPPNLSQKFRVFIDQISQG